MLEQREHLKTSPKVRLRPPRWSPTAGGFLFWASGILPSQFLPRFGINLLIFAPFRHGSVTVISALATSAFAGRMCHHTALHKLTASKAINTGHPGSISTIHADSPALALERLAMMVMRAGLNQTRQDVLDYARQTIDLIVQVGRRGGKRGVLQVYMPALAK